MASTSQEEAINPSEQNLIEDVKRFAWGETLDENVFARWCQGLIFSEDEPVALLQKEGGPCAILAPLQAFILKNILFAAEPRDDWRHIEADYRKNILIQSIAEIFDRVQHNDSYILVEHKDKQELTIETVAAQSAGEQSDSIAFHENLRTNSFNNSDEFQQALVNSYHSFVGDGGVLMLMYSVILTKGLQNIRLEVEDPSEPLIDGVFGHGSQNLINLMLTGNAVSHVFDFEKEIAGLKMQGISEQSTVGFLTLLENLRYCEVGSFLKSPKYPIWLLGSETHLTVFFSKELTLVAPETVWERARRIFSNYDTEGSGFITCVLLKDVLQELELVSIPEYVDIMRQKMDPDDTGIILQNCFMAEFFPEEPDRIIPEKFSVFHYNGLKRSCRAGKVCFIEGTASVPDPSDLMILSEATPLKSCLRTKWPSLEVDWSDHSSPSLN